YYELPDLQAIAGRVIEETVLVGNTNRWQGLLNLAHYAKQRTAPMICEFEGMPHTLGAMQGDIVTVSPSIPGWSDKRVLALESTDKSIGSDADNKIFKLPDWA